MANPSRAPRRALAFALALLLGTLCLGIFSPLAKASTTSVALHGLTFSYDGDSPARDVVRESPQGIVTVKAPSGKVSVQGNADSGLKQIIVDAQNKADIELAGVTIDRFSGSLNDGHHTVIVNAATELTVTGENKILANDTLSAIWSPTSLAIKGTGTLTVDETVGGSQNAAISIIAKDLTIGEKSATDGPTVKGLLLGGTLVYTGVTRADGTLTVNSGTVEANNPANFQQGLSAQTLTIAGGSVSASMSGRNSNALSATTVDICGGEVTASVSGSNTNAISAGKIIVSNGAGTGSSSEGPAVTLTAAGSAVKAVSCPVVLQASSAGNSDFYPWMARGGASSKATHILSFAGAGNATTAATTGITFDAKYLEIKPQALTKLAFAETGGGNHAHTGVKAGDTIPLGLSYRFDGVEPDASDFGTASLTTYFPVTDDTIAPYGNAESTYEGGTSGFITIGGDARGRTTSIAPEPWPLLSQIYGAELAHIIQPISFPMLYEVTLNLAGGTWSGVAGPLTTGTDGKVSVSGTPERTDYTFSYWQIDGEAIADLASHVFDEPTTITAVWVKDHVTVTFDPNGGRWGTSGTSITQQVERGTVCSAPAEDPTRSGKVFLGWYESKDNPKDPVNFSEKISEDKTFYAQWGEPELSLSPMAITAEAGSWVAFTATASVQNTPPGITPSTVSPEGLEISTKPQLNAKAPKVTGNTAAFEVQAPPANGVVEVTAEWMGKSQTAEITVQGGVDPAGQVTLTFQANGGTIGGAPFKTITLQDTNSMTSEEVASEVGTPSNANGSYEFLAWYEWIEVGESASTMDAEGVNDVPVHGYWHSVDFDSKTFDHSQELTAMWADTSQKSLVLWPPEATVTPSATVTFQAALISEPLNTGVLPLANYKPNTGNQIDPSKLTVTCIQGTESFGATIHDAIAGTPEGVAQFSVVAPNRPTTAYPGAVVLQASYTAGSDSYTATARLVVEAEPTPPPSTTSYAVTFEGNGGLWNGVDATRTVQVRSGGSVMSAPGGLANPGLELMGWYVKDASGAWQPVDLSTFRVAGPVTLTAQWGVPTLGLSPAIQVVKPGDGAILTASLALAPVDGAVPPIASAPIDLARLSFSASGECALGTPNATVDGAVVSITAPDAEGDLIITATYGELKATARLVVTGTAPVAIHRLYEPATGAHLLTSDTNEVFVLTSSRGWASEGVRFYCHDASAPGRTPVSRLFNPMNGDHLFTTDANEVKELVKGGWVDEGVRFYGSAPEGNPAVYRLWNTAQQAHGGLGSHLWTTDLNEYTVLPTMPSAGRWNQEGLAWHAVYVAEVANAEEPPMGNS